MYLNINYSIINIKNETLFAISHPCEINSSALFSPFYPLTFNFSNALDNNSDNIANDQVTQFFYIFSLLLLWHYIFSFKYFNYILIAFFKIVYHFTNLKLLPLYHLSIYCNFSFINLKASFH